MVNAQRTAITSTVLTAGAVAFEVLASLVLLLFVTFFLLKDGDRIWSWFLQGFGSVSPRVDRAGRAAWTTLSHYVQGTVAVAAVHGVIMGIVLAGMGVPLWAPLAVLIFFASFIPIVGIFFAGTVATLVTLGAKGPDLRADLRRHPGRRAAAGEPRAPAADRRPGAQLPPAGHHPRAGRRRHPGRHRGSGRWPCRWRR